MDLKLTNKTAFISGSTAGIGFATAKALLKENAIVIINGRSEKRIQTAIRQLKSEIPEAQVSGIVADFEKVEDINALKSQIEKVDILINNVATYGATSFFETTDADWQRQFEVNVMSGIRLSRFCLPNMLEKNWGRIIFISSECATLVPADLLAYSTTKTMILGLSRGLAHLTKGTNVTVNTIVPGSTLSEGAGRFLEEVAAKENKPKSQVEAEFFTEVRTSSLIQRFASVDEVANTITYIASPLAAATNGASIKVDGGSMGGL